MHRNESSCKNFQFDFILILFLTNWKIKTVLLPLFFQPKDPSFVNTLTNLHCFRLPSFVLEYKLRTKQRAKSSLGDEENPTRNEIERDGSLASLERHIPLKIQADGPEWKTVFRRDRSTKNISIFSLWIILACHILKMTRMFYN